MSSALEVRPDTDYAGRRRAYLQYAAAASAGGPIGFFSQLARLELAVGSVDAGPIREAIAYVDARYDCSDFAVAGLLRLLYRYRRSPMLESDLVADIERCVLGFKYWWDEPGEDPMCYWTENHQILFHSAELLAGQLFPDRVFRNDGRRGRDHVAHATIHLRRWFAWRRRFGFAEWLSNAYFDEDLAALANLRDFAADPAIRRLAESYANWLLYEIALHSFRGVFAATHGRTYPRMIRGGRLEPTSATSALVFGRGIFNDPSCMSAISLATSDYRCPAAIVAVAEDAPAEVRVRAHYSVEVEDAIAAGIDPEVLPNGAFFWGIECFVHPRLRDMSMRMLGEYRLWQYDEFKQYIDRYQQQIESHGDIPSEASDATALTAVDVQTFRTPDYQLSCAQDYRPGVGGYQQHIWQATLGMDAVVFTNHPGAADDYSRPNYWAGNGRLPRAAMHRNVLACVYDVPAVHPFPFSHAYLPVDAFDEVLERGHWTFARSGTGYVALYSQHVTRRGGSDEWIAQSPRNVWLCELGSEAQSGAFADFVASVNAARVAVDGLAVVYNSPSVGRFEFGWEGPLRVAGADVPLHGYPRTESRYATAEPGARAVEIRSSGGELRLDFDESDIAETDAG